MKSNLSELPSWLVADAQLEPNFLTPSTGVVLGILSLPLPLLARPRTEVKSFSSRAFPPQSVLDTTVRSCLLSCAGPRPRGAAGEARLNGAAGRGCRRQSSFRRKPNSELLGALREPRRALYHPLCYKGTKSNNPPPSDQYVTNSRRGVGNPRSLPLYS